MLCNNVVRLSNHIHSFFARVDQYLSIFFPPFCITTTLGNYLRVECCFVQILQYLCDRIFLHIAQDGEAKAVSQGEEKVKACEAGQSPAPASPLTTDPAQLPTSADEFLEGKSCMG
jgi:hypothetical protein